uniref:Reverse transcriptase domain-containing protein n=1 Tax=Fagus sylvatica TaxID=28930 RepID=A0A2N9GLL2_FAGSY
MDKKPRLEDLPITFTEEDARKVFHPHDDALVVTLEIAGYSTRRVLIDNGSSADIIYLMAFQQMKIGKDQLQPIETPLVGFAGTNVYPLGVISLQVVAGTYPKQAIKKVDFLVVDCPSSYNKRRVFAPERNTAIMEEVDKLLMAGFIREVYYPEWLANVVMVKKSTGKWRMCVDFTDLNKTCPKDSYPLPRIDQLVDSTAGHKLLSFMDAFSGYNQIQMAEEDQEKTAFITSRGLFCYKAIPFGLKNAGATYQRLVNKMFHDQIGRNVEVYVDDMLVKSKKDDDHLVDLKETFQALRRYNMKLNPAKCVFGVSFAHLGGSVCAKILSDPLQLGPRAKTLRQEVHFSYHMQLSDRQEFLRSSRNLSQKMTPWHEGTFRRPPFARSYLANPNSPLCKACTVENLPDSQQVDLRARAHWKEDTFMHDKETLGSPRIYRGQPESRSENCPQTDQKHPGGLCSRGHISQVQARISANPEPCKSRQRKLSDGTKNVKIRHRELGQICARTGTRFEKKRAGSKTHFFSRTAAFARRVFPARNKLIREPGCVGKIMTPATTWNSRFADSIPRLTGIYIGRSAQKQLRHPDFREP